MIERSRVSIGAAIKKYIFGNNAVLVNFHYENQPEKSWRLSFIAKEQQIEEGEIIKGETNPKRYTYVLGQNETCRTAAERFEKLSMETEFTIDKLKDAFSVEKLSKTFFDEYKEHYLDFVKHLNKRNIKSSVFNGDEKAIRDFAKKLLGRIVFLYFVQKKGWLGASNAKYADGSPNFLEELFITSGKNESFYNVWLKKLFYDTLNNQNRQDDAFKLHDGKIVRIPFLNGGLFEDDDPKGILTFPPKLFSDLFEFFKTYNFTIYEDSPDDHTIAVDPEMLGHIFENLLEDNKDKGAYYTPKEIVHYMCQESLIEYLATKLSITETASFQQLGNDQTEMFDGGGKKGQLALTQEHKGKSTGITRSDVAQFIKHKQLTDEIKKHSKDINKYLDEVKICDPAIGSGAFPMGLLHEIFNAKLLLNEETGINPAEVKQNIIQNSIYGVDIENGAVDIARLRFWLSLIVDEDKPRALPNLDYKIVVGDSLLPKFEGEVVDIDWDLKDAVGVAKPYVEKIKSGLKKIVEKQTQFFKTKSNKPKLQTEIRNLKIDLLINQLTFDKLKYADKNPQSDQLFEKTKKDKEKELEIKMKIAGYEQIIKKLEGLKKRTTQLLQFFDWKLDFPEIMNPAIADEHPGFDIVIGNPPYVDSENMVKNQPDIRDYISGRFSTARGNWDLYIPFHELAIILLKQSGVKGFISPNKWLSIGYGKELRKFCQSYFYKICDCSNVKVFEAGNSPVITFFKKLSNNKIEVDVISPSYTFNSKTIIPKNLLKDNNLGLLLAQDVYLLIKLNSTSLHCSHLINCENPFTTGEAYELIDIIQDKRTESQSYFKLINTGTIDPYVTLWGKKKTSYLKNKYDYPVILKSDFRNNFPKRFSQAESPKIIITGMRYFECYYDRDSSFIAGKSTLVLRNPINKDLFEYLLAILNSKLISYYIKQSYSSLGIDGGINFSKDIVDLLPMKLISNIPQSLFFKKVKKMINASEDEKTFAIFLNDVDLMVYKLYQLTYDEVLVVDKEFEKQMSHAEYDKLDYGFEYVQPDKSAIVKTKGRSSNFDLLKDLEF